MKTRLLAGCLGAIVGAALAARAQSSEPIYKADLPFSAVFGRSVTVRVNSASGSRDIDDPTLAQAAGAVGDHPSAVQARNAVASLQRSTARPWTCAELTALTLPWIRIRTADEMPAASDIPAYCKVIGVVDEEIGFEVDLPHESEWNRKFLMGGSGGFLGDLQNGSKTVALHRGYATAVTDTGHTADPSFAQGASWALNQPARLVNFGHRGTHLAAASAKLVIQAYYRHRIAISYFAGTSGSGRQAMMEAQRYPADFDGISAGCPGFNWTRMKISYAWEQQLMFPTADDQYEFHPVVPPGKVALLDAAVHAKCDAADGLEDGLIADPRSCRFDPRADLPICAVGEETPTCFTTRQADVIAKIHDGPSNSSGPIYPGTVYGGESVPGQWVTPAGGTAYVIGAPRGQSPYASRHYLLANEMFRYLVYGSRTYDIHAFDFERDVAATLEVSAMVDATDPDLTAFRSRGGKILFWNGWSDWASNAAATADYYERLTRKMGGPQQTKRFARLFLMPGVGHCTASDATLKTPNIADFLTPLERWVEHGIAPERIVASHLAPSGRRAGGASSFSMPVTGAVDRTRPLCPYPAVASYRGAGSIDDAQNFECSSLK